MTIWTRILVFDTETGGFSPERNGLTEIGAVSMIHDGAWCNAQVLARYSALVSPVDSLEYTQGALSAQSRTMDDLQAGRPEAEVLKEFGEWVAANVGPARTVCPWAHNAHFDLGFIDAACTRTGVPLPFNRSYRWTRWSAPWAWMPCKRPCATPPRPTPRPRPSAS
jgi:DNA polymerase III alpha subunit (gram-positive type)